MAESLSAKEFVGASKKAANKQTKATTDRCRRASSSAMLDINNVRTRINGTGNMWVEGSRAFYYIPASGTSTSLYCGALWVGGQDENDQLRVAALRFGSEGDDFWPGPLAVDGTASTNLEACNEWDKHFRITRAEVDAFRTAIAQGDIESIPDVIKNWPAEGKKANQSKYIAPFFDVDGDIRGVVLARREI